MKFAHLLAGFSAESETNADAFLDYKRLKKQLKKAFKPASKKPDDSHSEEDEAEGTQEAAKSQVQQVRCPAGARRLGVPATT